MKASNETLFDPIIQPGKGGLAFTPKLNYQLFFSKEGIQLGTSYQWSITGDQAYQFGNSFNLSVLYFKQFTIHEDYLAVPNLGFYLEKSNKDIYAKVIQELTGGTIGFGQLGFDFNKSKTTFSFLYQYPFFQKLNGNQILHQERISIGVVRSFKL